MNTDTILFAVRNLMDLADAEAAALACTPDERARLDAEFDAWVAAPLPLSLDTSPRPLA